MPIAAVLVVVIAPRVSPAFGQHGIRFREALADGDAVLAISLLPELDLPHRIELILGAALRDGREGFGAAHDASRAFAPGVEDSAAIDSLEQAIRSLARPNPDRTLDDIAAAYVAERRVPDVWRPGGRPLPPNAAEIPAALHPDVEVARLYADGVAGSALINLFADSDLFGPVAIYYSEGAIHAMGPRPLLILASFRR